MELYIDNRRADTDSGTGVAVSLSGGVVTDPGRGRAGYTRTVRLPMTAKNDAILGYAGEIHSREGFNAARHTGRIEHEGAVLFEGQLYLNRVEHSPPGGFYEVYIIGAAKEWAEGEYLLALWKGNTLSGEARRAVAEKHASFSGLKVDDILQHDLRVPLEYFAGNLLRDERQILGVYDARCAASGTAHSFEEDPSLFRAQMPAVSALLGMFTDELDFVKDEAYVFTNSKLHPNWDFSTGIPATTGGGCGFAGAVGDFAKSLRRNGAVKVFVASGRYDLMCNRDSSDFSINHMDVPEDVRKKIKLESYEGGHMFYTNPEARRLFRRDLEKFYRFPG